MARKKKTENAEDLPGLALSVFEAGVRSLAELRDSGQYMVFLGRQTSVKLVGEPQRFRSTLAERLGREVSEDEAEKALIEIRNFCRASVYFDKTDSIVRFLEKQVYDDEFEELGEERQSAFRELLGAKARLVCDHVYTDAIRQRSRRMETATGPCVEELDVELVKQRRDDLRGRNVTQPFLRLRVRYSEGDSPGFPYFAFAMPWGSATSISLPSFEFECDESDIDLLILRLTAAKNLLLESEDESREHDAK